MNKKLMWGLGLGAAACGAMLLLGKPKKGMDVRQMVNKAEKTLGM